MDDSMNTPPTSPAKLKKIMAGLSITADEVPMPPIEDVPNMTEPEPIDTDTYPAPEGLL